MNSFNLPKGLLDSVTSLMKSGKMHDAPLQEKIIKDNLSAVKAPSSVDAAYASIVAEGRRQEAERKTQFAQGAVEAHKRMGKTIAESIATPEAVVEAKQYIITESMLDGLVSRMHSLGLTKRMAPMTEQKELVGQLTRAFFVSFDEIVSQNVSEELLKNEQIAQAIDEVRAEIRLSLVNAINVANAMRTVDEASKILAIVAKHDVLEAKHAASCTCKGCMNEKKSNPDTDPYEKGNLKGRKEKGQGDAMDEAKKLDSVGKEDADVNNDGKVNSTDSFLKNRRKIISANIKEEAVEEGVMTKVKSIAKKAIEKLGHGSDEDLLKDLQKKAGVPQTGVKPTPIKEEEKPRSAGSVFDIKVAKTFAKKPGEGTGHEAKKISTGTVYTKKWKKDADETAADKKGVMEAKKDQEPEGLYSSKRFETDGQRVARIAKEKMQAKKSATSTDTPGNSYAHQCAVHVKHAKLGEGKTLFSQHAQPDANGEIAWYDVMFEDEILRVNTKELEILVSESHMNHKKK